MKPKSHKAKRLEKRAHVSMSELNPAARPPMKSKTIVHERLKRKRQIKNSKRKTALSEQFKEAEFTKLNQKTKGLRKVGSTTGNKMETDGPRKVIVGRKKFPKLRRAKPKPEKAEGSMDIDVKISDVEMKE